MNAFHLMIPSRELPPFSEVPRSKASDLRIVSDTKWDDYMSEIPQKAITSDGTSRFFKPADDKKQLLREVDMHLRIREAGLRDTIKVANLHSIVVSDDAKMTIGLLSTLYPQPVTPYIPTRTARWPPNIMQDGSSKLQLTLSSYILIILCGVTFIRVILLLILASTPGL